jgi:hypothetical protein
VGGGTAGDAEALHDALEALALGDADDVDELAFGEGATVTTSPTLSGGRGGEADLAEHAGRSVEAGLLRVAELGLGGVLGLLGLRSRAGRRCSRRIRRS